jgi:hypothetical protein
VYSGPIIDCDVHHNWASERELLPYLPAHWRDFVTERPHGRYPLTPRGGGRSYQHMNGLPYRIDALGPNGIPGSDYPTVKEQLLDAYNIDRVIVGFDIGFQQGITNPELSVVACKAANDWCIDKWLSLPDERIRGVVMIPTQDVEVAAAEIRRVGRHPRMCAVLMVFNGMNKPFGHPVYHPIYQAAVEMGLPIQIHSPINRGYPGGDPLTRMEWHSLGGGTMAPHISSLISFGVFEAFPDLRMLSVEVGVTWLPWLLGNLDARWDELKRESPLVRKLPSEYFREHVKMSTQPLEMGTRDHELVDVLETFEGIDDLLCFSTDYPHWDADDPLYIARKLPQAWLPKVMWRNARDIYGYARPFAGASAA